MDYLRLGIAVIGEKLSRPIEHDVSRLQIGRIGIGLTALNVMLCKQRGSTGCSALSDLFSQHLDADPHSGRLVKIQPFFTFQVWPPDPVRDVYIVLRKIREINKVCLHPGILSRCQILRRSRRIWALFKRNSGKGKQQECRTINIPASAKRRVEDLIS